MDNKNIVNNNLIISGKKINLPRVKSGAFRLNKQKLLNQKMESDRIISNFNISYRYRSTTMRKMLKYIYNI